MTQWDDWILEGADVRLAPSWLPAAEADDCLARLLEEVAWQREELRLFGRVSEVPRRVAWQADPGVRYRYSGVTHTATGWSPTVCEIRRRLEADLPNETFNGVLLNLYRDGRDSMGWHSDDERELGPDPVIASVSLGAVRPLRMRRRTPTGYVTSELELPHGSLLVMRGATQANWQHALPRRVRITAPRVNLTFRDLTHRA